VYNEALAMVKQKLREAEVITLVSASVSSTIWHSSVPMHPGSVERVTAELVDCTFVDDEAVILLASSHRKLDHAIDIALNAFVDVFSTFSLVINWAPGKSECMLAYRRHGATDAFERRRIDGKICVKLSPKCGNAKLTVVSKYKHLGTITSMDGSPTQDATLRAASAMQAYGPLSSKIFGSNKIQLWLKLHFMSSLVLSRLLFQTQVWVPNAKASRTINGPYMRCLRRMCGAMRYSSDCALSDVQVRIKLMQPSIDCLLMRRRLAYAARVYASRCKVLSVLLSAGGDGSTQARRMALPWSALLQKDLIYMYRHHVSDIFRICNMNMHGDCVTHPCAWHRLLHHERWPEVVNRVFHVESILDKEVVDSNTELGFVCAFVQSAL